MACALAAALLCTAWLADDCFFTLRTVEQLLAGRGPRWNAFERVQAYTHPLWMLLLSGAIGLTREYYFTTLAVGLLVTGAAVVWLVRLAPTASARIGALVLLCASRAFVDYSTSGLENPLSHLCGAAALWVALRGPDGPRGVLLASLVTALAALNRLDAVLLFSPLVVARLVALRPSAGHARGAIATRTLGALAAGFAPLAAWLGFAFVYYGFPFPNTAYAKLGAGAEPAWLAQHGVIYLRECLLRDPLTVITIAAGVVMGLARPFRGSRALSIGILLHLAYLVRVGGDFMLGRFLSPPFFVAVGLLALRPWRMPSTRAARAGLTGAAALAVALAIPLHRPGLLRAWGPRPYVVAGVGDERARYYCGTGLLRAKGRFRPLTRSFAGEPPHPFLMALGRHAFEAGPDVLAVERWGLADPLLARLPARDAEWRVGHYQRVLPTGYVETLASGKNRIADPQLARYHELLRAVTRGGALLEPARLRTALALNLGRHEHLIDRLKFRYPALRSVPLRADADGAFRAGPAVLPPIGLRFELPHGMRVGTLVLRLASGALAEVQLLDGNAVTWSAEPGGVGPELRLDLGGVRASALWVRPAEGVRVRLEGVEIRAAAGLGAE
jgi:arabinofuranosyltransferase